MLSSSDHGAPHLLGLPDSRLLRLPRRAYGGTPQDFMHLIDHLHKRGIGVILDWVHFPPTAMDSLALTAPTFTSTPSPSATTEWKSYVFNLGETRFDRFLSAAVFWPDRYRRRYQGGRGLLDALPAARRPGSGRQTSADGNRGRDKFSGS